MGLLHWMISKVSLCSPVKYEAMNSEVQCMLSFLLFFLCGLFQCTSYELYILAYSNVLLNRLVLKSKVVLNGLPLICWLEPVRREESSF